MLEFVKGLVEKGLNINHQNKGDRTPLYYAISNENVDIVNFLIENGADVNIIFDGGNTILTAYHRLTVNLMNIIIAAGTDVNHKNDRGITALMQISMLISQCQNECEYENMINMIKLLIENGADINLKDNEGEQP